MAKKATTAPTLHTRVVRHVTRYVREGKGKLTVRKLKSVLKEYQPQVAITVITTSNRGWKIELEDASESRTHG